MRARARRNGLALALGVSAGLWCGATTVAGQTVAIVGGTVHTVSGPTIENGVVVMRDGRIVAVGAAGEVTVPPGATRVEAAGKIVTPGLIDAATQIGLIEVGSLPATRDGTLQQGSVRARFQVADVVNPYSMVIPVVRSDGVTSVITAPSGGVVAGRGALLDLVDGDRATIVRDPDVALYLTLGPSAAGSVGGSRGGVLLELRDALDGAREEAGSEDPPGPEAEPLVRALAGELPVVVRAGAASDIETALDLAAEYGLRLVIEGGEEAWVVADRLAEADVPVILLALENRPSQFDRLATRFDGAALLHQAGVRVIVSTFDSHAAGQLPHQAGSAARFGLPWEVALRAVTLEPADAFGAPDLGRLEIDAVANVVVWSDDPLDFSGYAERVWIRGVEVDLDSRQRRLFERYRTLDGSEGYRAVRR